MFYTVRGLLKDRGVRLEDTVYRNCNEQMLDFKIASGDFYEIPDLSNGILRFKNAADLLCYGMLCEQLPYLNYIVFRHKKMFPYYGEDLDKVYEGLRNEPESVCVEGGPCLFGEHEVTAVIEMKDGTSYLFDYSTGKKYNNQENGEYAQTDLDLAGCIEQNGENIKDIVFHNHKTGLTYQEYLHVFFPFAIANALHVSLVMTLPDMSYRKYLEYCLRYLNEDLKEKTIKEFDEILYKISDMYIELIETLKGILPVTRFALVHGRDQKMMDLFYEKRAPFIERNKVLRSLTSNTAKLESIKDYISMPALPYYVFGSKYIIEVNSMDETDSYRKCRKAHKNEVVMGCILFPELLSEDGINTLYCTTLEYKDYGKYESELE